jgi:hypothetical protein
MVEGALEVAEDALDGYEMGIIGVVHVEAHLLDRVGDVRPSEGEVLESPSEAVVGSRVADGPLHIRGDLGLSVNWRGTGLAVAHASALKVVSSVLALVKEEVAWSLLHRDAEEVVERVEILHCELLLESCSGTLEKFRARGSEDDIIDVEQQVSSVGVAIVDEQQGV